MYNVQSECRDSTQRPAPKKSERSHSETPVTARHQALSGLRWGWVKTWEEPNGIPAADIPWLRDDSERGLFSPDQIYEDTKGQIKKRRVLKSDRMWFYPPEPPGYARGYASTPHLFRDT